MHPFGTESIPESCCLMEGEETAVICRACRGSVGSPWPGGFHSTAPSMFLSCEYYPPGWRPGWNWVSCHFCEDGPLCRKARSDNEKGPTVAQDQVWRWLQNSKGNLVINAIFLTCFIRLWHFGSRNPSNNTTVLRHHDRHLVFRCFQLLFLILSKAVCQELNKSTAKEPAFLIRALSLIHEFCAEMWRRATRLLYSATVTMFGMKKSNKPHATWRNYWWK